MKVKLASIASYCNCIDMWYNNILKGEKTLCVKIASRYNLRVFLASSPQWLCVRMYVALHTCSCVS